MQKGPAAQTIGGTAAIATLIGPVLKAELRGTYTIYGSCLWFLQAKPCEWIFDNFLQFHFQQVLLPLPIGNMFLTFSFSCFFNFGCKFFIIAILNLAVICMVFIKKIQYLVIKLLLIDSHWLISLSVVDGKLF